MDCVVRKHSANKPPLAWASCRFVATEIPNLGCDDAAAVPNKQCVRMFDLNFRHEPESTLLTSVLEAATHVKGTAEEWVQLGTILSCQADQPMPATEVRTRFWSRVS